MTAFQHRFALLLVLLLAGGGGADEIQKWQTPDGKLHFGSYPPPGSTLLGTTESLGTSGGGGVDESPPVSRPRSDTPPPAPQRALGGSPDAPVDIGVSLSERSRLYFDTYSQRGLSSNDLYIIERNLNAVRNDVGRELGVDQDARFKVIISDAKVFQGYSGMGEHVAGLFDGRIHIPIPSNVNESELQGVLWHEYTHAVILTKAGGRCPSWLNEGIAVYQQAKIDSKLRSVIGRELIGPDGKLLLTWAELERTFHSQAASPQAKGAAYRQAFAVADYLYTRYRSRRVNDLLERLRTDDVETALRETFQLTLDKLDRQVIEHIQGG